jgi:hypothetical protein
MVLLHFIHIQLLLDYQESPRLLGSTLLSLNVGVRSVTDDQRCHGVRYVRDLRSTESVLGRGPLVLGSVLLDTAVLGRLVVVTTASVSTLGTLNVGVGAVADSKQE